MTPPEHYVSVLVDLPASVHRALLAQARTHGVRVPDLLARDAVARARRSTATRSRNVAELHAAGLGTWQIAAQLDLTNRAAYEAQRALGLTPNPVPRPRDPRPVNPRARKASQ